MPTLGWKSNWWPIRATSASPARGGSGRRHGAAGWTDALCAQAGRLRAGALCLAEYCESHPPIHPRGDLEQHRWVGYVEDLAWTQELNYLPQVSNIAPPLHISNVISQMSIAGGAGIGVLPLYMARREPVLMRILPDMKST